MTQENKEKMCNVWAPVTHMEGPDEALAPGFGVAQSWILGGVALWGVNHWTEDFSLNLSLSCKLISEFLKSKIKYWQSPGSRRQCLLSQERSWRSQNIITLQTAKITIQQYRLRVLCCTQGLSIHDTHGNLVSFTPIHSYTCKNMHAHFAAIKISWVGKWVSVFDLTILRRPKVQRLQKS